MKERTYSSCGGSTGAGEEDVKDREKAKVVVYRKRRKGISVSCSLTFVPIMHD